MGADDLRKWDSPGRRGDTGKLTQNWKKVLPAKFIGIFCVYWADFLSDVKDLLFSWALWQEKGFEIF